MSVDCLRILIAHTHTSRCRAFTTSSFVEKHAYIQLKESSRGNSNQLLRRYWGSFSIADSTKVNHWSNPNVSKCVTRKTMEGKKATARSLVWSEELERCLYKSKSVRGEGKNNNFSVWLCEWLREKKTILCNLIYYFFFAVFSARVISFQNHMRISLFLHSRRDSSSSWNPQIIDDRDGHSTIWRIFFFFSLFCLPYSVSSNTKAQLNLESLERLFENRLKID